MKRERVCQNLVGWREHRQWPSYPVSPCTLMLADSARETWTDVTHPRQGNNRPKHAAPQVWLNEPISLTGVAYRGAGEEVFFFFFSGTWTTYKQLHHQGKVCLTSAIMSHLHDLSEGRVLMSHLKLLLLPVSTGQFWGLHAGNHDYADLWQQQPRQNLEDRVPTTGLCDSYTCKPTA